MTDPAWLSATRLASLIRGRKVGCLELLDHYLARVERFNPSLNAIIATDVPRARRRAREADRVLARGDRWGPLHGVPMTVKDSFDVAGLPTTWGSPAHRNNIARTDALSVKRLRDAGAVIFGKTNVPIWLADAQSFNDIYGTTRNPWDPDRSPGGSSGGAAAALAAGMTGLELGSDIAGSVRNPAAWCGLFAHKPTMGICPTDGHALDGNRAPLDMLVIGPLARSAADLSLLLSVIAGLDEIDAAGFRLTLPRPRKKRLDEYRVSLLLADETVPTSRDIRALHEALARFLRRSRVKVGIGARPGFDAADSHRVFDVLLRAATSGRQTDEEFAANAEARRKLAPDDDSKRARMLRGVTLSHRDWLRLDEARHRSRWKWHEFFQRYDLLLAPITVSAAMRHDHTPPYARSVPVDGAMQPFMNQVSLPGYANLAFLPSTVAPIGLNGEGLPVGIQIIGPQYGDLSCIHFARLLEQGYRTFVPPPGYD